MRIDFDEQYHAYAVDGDIADISVTELLHKHNLAPNYKDVPAYILHNAASKGKAIHKEIELYINNAVQPESKQAQQYKDYFDENIENGIAERPIAINYDGLIVCGTTDLICKYKNGEYAICDHKCTSILDRNYVSWQVSILDYMFKKQSGNEINGATINWQGADKLYVNHFSGDKDLQVIELSRVPDSEIEKLLQAERTGTTYKPQELVIDKSIENDIIVAENKAYELERAYKQAKEEQERWRKALLEKMEQQGIKTWTSSDGLMTVTYVAESRSVGIDTKKVKEFYPNVAVECAKETIKKPYVRVTRRELDGD